MLAVSFYDDVLRELIVALGAALFIGNVVALVRRRTDRRAAAQGSAARSRPGSPVREGVRSTRDGQQLPQAPVLRTVTYLVLGFVVMVWGIASLVR
jgi:hypothetical protein